MHGRFFPFLRRDEKYKTRDVENATPFQPGQPGGFLAFLEYEQIPSEDDESDTFDEESATLGSNRGFVSGTVLVIMASLCYLFSALNSCKRTTFR